MKLVRFEAAGRPAQIGILTIEGVLPTGQTDMLAVIASGGRPAS